MLIVYIHKIQLLLLKNHPIQNYVIWLLLIKFFSFLMHFFGINIKFRIFYEVLRWVKTWMMIWELCAARFFLIIWESLRKYWITSEKYFNGHTIRSKNTYNWPHEIKNKPVITFNNILIYNIFKSKAYKTVWILRNAAFSLVSF